MKPGDIIDDHRLVRVIGEGGFGRVWLCVSETLNQPYALKEIQDLGEAAERELVALQNFKRQRLGRGSGIMPIEHVGRSNGVLYYVMPLADGVGADDPANPEWRPLTFGLRLRRQTEEKAWFESQQIISWIVPMIRAADWINREHLFHRDIKPDNILFVEGEALLCDFSLLRNDSPLATSSIRVGTPGYQAPRWYIESGGLPDMYGLAVTLYVALSGKEPDTLGLQAEHHWWPPQGRGSLSPEEQMKWKRLHHVVLRATTDDPSDRFVDFEAFAEAVINSDNTQKPQDQTASQPAGVGGVQGGAASSRLSWALSGILIGTLALCCLTAFNLRNAPTVRLVSRPQAKTNEVAGDFHDGAVGWLLGDGWNAAKNEHGVFVLRADSKNEMHAVRTNVLLKAAWEIDTSLEFRDLYADDGKRGLMSLFLCPDAGFGGRLLATFDQFFDGSVSLDLSWFDTSAQKWIGVAKTGWLTGLPGPLPRYQVKLSRALGSDHVVFSVIGSNGFARSLDGVFPVLLLDRSRYAGLRANWTKIDVSSFQVSDPPALSR